MESFYRSLFYPQVRILGFKLQPFCLWHYSLLKAIENPFLTGEGEIKSHDLILALKICSLSSRDTVEIKLNFKEKFLAFLLARSLKLLTQYCQSFQFYLNEHHYGPEYWEQVDGNECKGFSHSPEELIYIVSLLKVGIPHEEAWLMPFGYMSWLNAAILESNGYERTFTDPLDDDFEDPPELTEEQLLEQAIKDLGEERARAWWKKRQQNNVRS
ncbi:MAG: hypothetical protein NE327_09160 [Lentisphaeraceae bacterium]|nr:hypothetical protein [Lentisphaeraceae bacterium]